MKSGRLERDAGNGRVRRRQLGAGAADAEAGVWVRAGDAVRWWVG